MRHLLDRAHDIEGAVQAAAEGDPAFLDVRARDIELERVHPFSIGEDSGQLDVLVEGAAADVDDVGDAESPELGQLLGDVPVHANTLKADGVEHPGRRLDDSLWRVPFTRGEEEPFRSDGPERGQVHGIGVLDTVTVAAARRDERIRELEGSDSVIEKVAVSVMIPDQICSREHRTGQTRADEVMATAGLAYGDDAAVAASHPASHHAFDRHLRRCLVGPPPRVTQPRASFPGRTRRS